MGLAGPPSEVLFDVTFSHQSGMDSCFSRMVVRRIHCNEWTGWAEQVSRRGLVSFSLFFLIPSLSCFYFLESSHNLAAQRLVPREATA
jgi:hypothetical protein